MAIGNPITSENNYRLAKFVATQGQTLFTIGNGYQIGRIAVFKNGVRLTDGIDFTAADGTTVTLNVGTNLNDDVVVEVLDTFSVADADVVGIQSSGSSIGNAKTLNFVGTGNTFRVSGNTIDVSISSGGATGGGIDKVFQENQRVVNTNYTLSAGYSAMSVGPVTISAGATVTIPGSERWVVL